ncbi:MAG: hypothetical protein PWP71_2622, partial [Clostridia bacterium]|nr:hypothetical protein [Clostridia bacterium]
ELVDDLQTSITKVFAGDEYEEQKNQLIKKFSNEKQKMLQELHRFAEEKGFILKYANSGYVSIPVLEGKQINADEYDNLDVEIKEKIEKNSLEVQEKAIEVLKQIQQIEKNAKEKIKNLQDETALFAIGHLIKNLQDKYSKNEKIIKYLENVQNDILCNLETFMETEEDEKFPLPWFKKGGKEGILLKYKVNVLVDNSEWKGAPVIFEFNPTYHNLIGRIEYVNELGVITTDYTKIKPGALHKANGGYLVLQAKDVLTNPFAWDGLKRVLKTQELTIEDLREQFGAVSISSLKPEPIKINVKIILLGNPYLYHLLYNLDEDFRKLFKIKADFDSEMDLNRIHMEKMAAFISSHCQQENIKHFDRTGIAKVIEYSTRLAGNQNKLTTRFNELVEILYEADAYARFDESQYVTAKHVEQAIREKKFRSNKYEEKIHEMFEQGKILITIEGKVVGQINGLAVVNLGDYSFGKPNRITAATYMGRSGVINIEREIRMSGSIHDKGLLILTGFLGEKFAQERPLALSASLCFEQLYGGIEGDSASSTELYALLSSLADVPIYQGIAVTGSVNQKGEIQPVGGVTEKIEGFFKICKQKGLTGEQGVIIPKQNVSDLVLDEEVVEAVKNKQFNIYAVDNIDQGIEILTGIPAGEKDKNGKYPEGSINYLVEQKLNKYLKSFLEIKKEYSSEEPA